MRKIVLHMFTTLDGFIAGPNGEFDDYEPSVEEHQFANQFFGAADGILFGRVTYEGFVDYWDALDPTDLTKPAIEREFATIFQKMTRIVISRTLEAAKGNDILIQGNIAGEVARLKDQPDGYFVLVCGPELLATLLQHGLVDEFQILVKPKVLGQGFALFGKLGEKLSLKLLSTKVFGSGCVLHHYQVA